MKLASHPVAVCGRTPLVFTACYVLCPQCRGGGGVLPSLPGHCHCHTENEDKRIRVSVRTEYVFAFDASSPNPLTKNVQDK